MFVFIEWGPAAPAGKDESFVASIDGAAGGGGCACPEASAALSTSLPCAAAESWCTGKTGGASGTGEKSVVKKRLKSLGLKNILCK
jgi:hypothetical protein